MSIIIIVVIVDFRLLSGFFGGRRNSDNEYDYDDDGHYPVHWRYSYLAL